MRISIVVFDLLVGSGCEEEEEDKDDPGRGAGPIVGGVEGVMVFVFESCVICCNVFEENVEWGFGK